LTRWPWESVRAFLERLAAGHTVSFERDDALALALVVILGIVVTIRFRPPYVLYVWGTVWVVLMRYRPAPYSQFDGMFRYPLVLFPCFMVLGMGLRRWWLLALYVVGGLYWQLGLLGRFVNSIWVA
jgi:hypothetical protein